MNISLVLVFATALLIGVSYGMHGPVLPIFAKNEIGATYAELGFIGLANFIPYMFIPLFVGFLLHRFNNGYLLSVGVIINSAAVYLLSISQSVPEIMSFRIMTGIAHAFFWPPSESIISKISEGQERVRNIARFTGFFVAGFMIGPLAGTFILENFDESYRLLFQITAFVLASAIIATIWCSRNKITVVKQRVSLLSIKEMKKFPYIIAIIVYFNVVFGTILVIYPAFLNDLSFSGVEVELLFFVFGISRVATLFFAGRLAKKTSLTLIIACFSIVLGLLLSFSSDDIIVFGLALLSMGFGFGIFFPLTLEVVLSKTRESIRGAIIGAYETIFGIGWVIGPITAGFISQFYENSTPYFVFFIIGLAITSLSILKRRMLEPETT